MINIKTGPMEIGEWGQDEQQGRRPHTSRLQDEINIKFSIIRRSPAYSPVDFYVIHPRGRWKIKHWGLYFIYLFINGPIFSKGTFGQVGLRWRWDRRKKSGLNFTPHAPCQFAAAVKRAKVPRGPPPTAIQRRAQQKDSEQGPARKCHAADKNQHAGDKK